jgi:hypothetical protein
VERRNHGEFTGAANDPIIRAVASLHLTERQSFDREKLDQYYVSIGTDGSLRGSAGVPPFGRLGDRRKKDENQRTAMFRTCTSSPVVRGGAGPEYGRYSFVQCTTAQFTRMRRAADFERALRHLTKCIVLALFGHFFGAALRISGHRNARHSPI